MGNNNQIKNYILCLNLKLGDKTTKTIKIKSLNECPSILEELRTEGKSLMKKRKN